MRDALTKKERKRKHPPIKKKKEIIKLSFKNCTIENYIDYTDILKLTFNEFLMIVDDVIEVPEILIKHSRPTDFILRKPKKMLKIDNFKLIFDDPNNNIDILFDTISANIFSLHLFSTIMKVANYYAFFGEFVDEAFVGQYTKDDNDRERFGLDNISKSSVNLKMKKIHFKINENPVSSSSILLADYSVLEEKEKAGNVIAYLKSLKSDQFALKVLNFELKVSDFKERVSRKTLMENKFKDKLFKSSINNNDDLYYLFYSNKGSYFCLKFRLNH